jgi:hypothetical protein
MTAGMPQPPVPVAVVDALTSLLEADENSIFLVVTKNSPYLSRADGELRQQIDAMAQAKQRYGREIHDLIEELGGHVRLGRAAPADQYLAYLSLKFLLPKLVEEKKLCIRRYENALKTIGANGPDHVPEVLKRHLGEMRQELQVLEGASAKVLASGHVQTK